MFSHDLVLSWHMFSQDLHVVSTSSRVTGCYSHCWLHSISGAKPLKMPIIAYCHSQELLSVWFEGNIKHPLKTLHLCHNGRDGVSNHQRLYCLFNRLFRRRSKKTSKLRVTGLCAGNSLVTGEFPTQSASNAENVSIWWCHHDNMNMNICYGPWVATSAHMIAQCQRTTLKSRG